MAKKPKIQYSPAKQYRWNADDKIVFTGKEYDILFKAIGRFMTGTIDVPNILRLAEAYKVLNDKLISYVEEGKILEAEPQVPVETGHEL